MSRESYYRGRAADLEAMATGLDFENAKVLRQAAQSWRLLADLEAAGAGRPTRWDHRSPSAPRGVYDKGD